MTQALSSQARQQAEKTKVRQGGFGQNFSLIGV
jgi:hypothetical protein